MKHRDRKREKGGFISLEALVAFAILTMSVTAIYQVFGNAYFSIARLSEKDLVLAEAQSLVEATGITVPIRIGRQSGTFDSGITWTMDTRPIAGPTDDTDGGFRRYWIQLSARTGSGREVLQLETIVIEGDAR